VPKKASGETARKPNAGLMALLTGDDLQVIE